MASTSLDHSKFDTIYGWTLELIQTSSKLQHLETTTATGENGLANIGQSCFCNAVLQCLLNTPQFASLYIGKRLRNSINVKNPLGSAGAMTGCMSALTDFILSGQAKWVSSRAFLTVFASEVHQEFNGEEQEDAHEFQTLLVGKLSEDVQEVNNPIPFKQDFQTKELDAATLEQFAEQFLAKQRNFNSSIINDIFKLTTITLITCSSCDNVIVNFEEQNHLSVDINLDPLPSQPASSNSLDQCLANHFGQSIMDTRCSKCDKERDPKPSPTLHYLWTLPNILVIQLKRFDFKDGKAVKNNRIVSFPLTNLDLIDYLHPDERQKLDPQNTKYSLYAVLVHRGKHANSGHYIARVKNLNRNGDSWGLFDDKHWKPIKEENAQDPAAYMLYYCRNGMPKGWKPPVDKEQCTKKKDVTGTEV